MKKYFSIIRMVMVALIILSCMFAFIACDKDKQNGHQCVFNAQITTKIGTYAKCTETTKTCKSCGKVEVVSVSQHKFKNSNPILIKDGETAMGYEWTHTCEVCNFAYTNMMTANDIAAAGLPSIQDVNEQAQHIWSQTEVETNKAEYDAYLAKEGKADNVPVDNGYIAKYYKITRSCSHCNKTEVCVERRDEINPNSKPTQGPGPATPTPIPTPDEGDKECKHTYKAKITNPTCDAKGYTQYTCSKCGKSYTSDYINAIGHRWSSWKTTTATCTANGAKTRSCANCKKTESETIKATGHKYGAWTVTSKPTCDKTGIEIRKCSSCGHSETRIIAATAHIWDEGKTTVTPTSCSDMGVIKYTCKVCSKTKMEQITGVHTYGNWYYEDYTYTIDHGSLGIETIDSHRKVRSCTKCGFKEYANIAKHPCGLGYDTNKTTIIKQPVCDTPGIKRVQCTICGWYQDMDYTQAGVGHKLTEKKVHLSDYTQYTNELDATITTCSVCGKQAVRYHYGKGYNDYNRWRVPIMINPGTAYVGNSPVNDDFAWVNHPTWQTVSRDHVYDSAGYVKQFTVYWHDKNGKRYSAIVKCGEGEMEALFASVGTYPSAKVTAWSLQISGTWLRPYMIHYQ